MEARVSVSTPWLQSGAMQSIFMQYEQMEDQNANVITRLQERMQAHRVAAEQENNRGDFRALIISTFGNYH
jgi:hypothetical protein